MRIEYWFFDPLLRSADEVLAELRRLPVGWGARFGSFVYAFDGHAMKKARVDKIPVDMFTSGIDHMEDFMVQLLLRVRARDQLSPIHEFRIQPQHPGSVFSMGHHRASLVWFTDTDRSNVRPNYFDTSVVPLGTITALDLTCPMITYKDRRVNDHLIHSGDVGQLCHMVSAKGDLPNDGLYAVTFTGYRSGKHANGTPLRLFGAQMPMGGTPDVSEKVIHSIRCPIDSVTVGDHTHALVAVFMRREDRVWWYVLPVPELATGVDTGKRTSDTRAGEARARTAALRAFMEAGAIVPLAGAVEREAGLCGDSRSSRSTRDHPNHAPPASVENVCLPTNQDDETLLQVDAPVSCIETLEADVDPGLVLGLTTGPCQTLFVTYHTSVRLHWTPVATLTTTTTSPPEKGPMLPLASMSCLRGTPAAIGLGTTPVGTPSLSRKVLWKWQQGVQGYIMHMSDQGRSPDTLIGAPTYQVNGIAIMHLSKDAVFMEKLLTPQALASVRSEVATLRASRVGRRMSAMERDQIQRKQQICEQHDATLRFLLSETRVTAFTAQLGPCGTGLLELGGRYFIDRQSVVLPGLLDRLFGAGEEVTDQMDRDKLLAWVAAGGLQQAGFPVMYKRGSQRVFTRKDQPMVPINELFPYVSSFTLLTLSENLQLVQQIVRQLPYILEPSAIETVKSQLIRAVTALAADSPGGRELDAQIQQAGRNGDGAKVWKLYAAKRGRQKKNQGLIAALVADLQALRSDVTCTKKANHTTMGLGLLNQVAHMHQNLRRVATMTPEEVLDFADGALVGVLALEADRVGIQAALQAVANKVFLEYAQATDLSGVMCVGLQHVILDGLTYCAMAQGGQSDRHHPLALDDTVAKGLFCPAGVSTGHAPSWLASGASAPVNVAVTQNSLLPVPLFRRFKYMDSLLQYWQELANKDDVQIMRQLMRGQLCGLRAYQIHGGSLDLSFFFIVSTLQMLDAYCEQSRVGNTLAFTLSETARKSLVTVAELEDELGRERVRIEQRQSELNSHVHPDGTTASSDQVVVAALEKEIEKREAAIESECPAFFDTKSVTTRAMFGLALTYCGAGTTPACFVYELFTPHKVGFVTPPADQFFLWPKFVASAFQTGCPIQPVVDNTRRFLLGELWKFLQPIWQDMSTQTAALDAMERETLKAAAGTNLRALQRVIPVIFHMAGMDSSPASKDLRRDIAERALECFSEDWVHRFVHTDRKGGRGAGIMIRFLHRVRMGSDVRTSELVQHALNIWTKRSAFADTNRTMILEKLLDGSDLDRQMVTARFFADCFGLQAKALGLRFTKETALAANAPATLRYLSLAEKRVQLLQEISSLTTATGSETAERTARLASLEVELERLDCDLPVPITSRGPSSDLMSQQLKDTLYLIVRGKLDKLTLEAKKKQEGLPWSVETKFQEAGARYRACQAKGDEDGQEKELVKMAELREAARLEAAAAEADIEYVLTGIRTTHKDHMRTGIGSSREHDLAIRYKGPHASVVLPLLKFGHAAEKAIAFCGTVDDLNMPEIWTGAQIPLDQDIFTELLRLVGISKQKVDEFLRQAILIFIAGWRDRGQAIQEAMSLCFNFSSA